jgi:hypothetical protein
MKGGSRAGSEMVLPFFMLCLEGFSGEGSISLPGDFLLTNLIRNRYGTLPPFYCQNIFSV